MPRGRYWRHRLCPGNSSSRHSLRLPGVTVSKPLYVLEGLNLCVSNLALTFFATLNAPLGAEGVSLTSYPVPSLLSLQSFPAFLVSMLG